MVNAILFRNTTGIHNKIEITDTFSLTEREEVSERDWNWLKSPAAESFNGGGLRGLTHDPFLKFKRIISQYI